ncbi:MAG: hypothetical protein OYL97_09240 [Candidatus Poribacteria bacterium]|nr:hypothetical protein [Candidatus Poribacteria bacterium]
MYRSHCGLLWRIMFPVAIIAIPAHLVVILWSTHAYTDKIDEITENEFDTQFTSEVSTNFGASYEFLVPKSEATKWRFIGIYLLTGWLISVIDSVLMGAILWGFSLFISDLAAIQGALSPLKFLTLFIGADIQILLPQLLSTWVMVAILGIDVLIKTFLLPIWAILTTYLYLERVDA